jgi:hypothetical protein
VVERGVKRKGREECTGGIRGKTEGRGREEG